MITVFDCISRTAEQGSPNEAGPRWREINEDTRELEEQKVGKKMCVIISLGICYWTLFLSFLTQRSKGLL